MVSTPEISASLTDIQTEVGRLVRSRQRGGSVPRSGSSRLSEAAYARVLEMLFDRKISSGAFVSQSDLVRLLGVGIAPLRDALKLLQSEGIVIIHPRSGIQFVKPGFELTRATFQHRIILERPAAAAFAEIAEPPELEEMEVRHLALIESIQKNGLTELAKAEAEALETLLHGTIIRSLANPLIDSSYRRLHNYVRLIRLERRVTAPMVLRSLREHLSIVAACKAHDSEAAANAVQDHLAAALQRSLGL
jgi:DNA-binding GntR family transcriptional regulator